MLDHYMPCWNKTRELDISYCTLCLSLAQSPDLAPPDNPEGSNASLAVDVLIETQALIQPEGLSKALQAIDGGFDLSRIAKDGEDVAKMVADAQITIP